MKKTNIKGAAVILAGLAILTACKKEINNPVQPTAGKTAAKGSGSGTEKNAAYNEGIMSTYYDGSIGAMVIPYYEFYGPTPGVQSPTYDYVSNGTTSVQGFGASAGIYAVAYKDSYGTQYLEAPGFYSTPILTAAYGIFVPPIEEIELDPQTGNVYALVTESNAKRIYVIDRYTGVATLVTVNGASNAFNSVSVNGYKSGSIAFVPDGSGGFEFVFSNESHVYASLGLVSWHYTLSGTNLTSVVAHHRTYSGVPPGTGVSTTYGNGKLYFKRDGSTDLYSLPLTGPSSNPFTYEGTSQMNITNDLGYYKEY